MRSFVYRRIRKTRIVIGCTEVANIIGCLAKAYRNKGCEVLTIAEPSQRYGTSFNISPANFLGDYLKSILKIGVLARLFHKVVWLSGPATYKKVEDFFRKRVVTSADVYIQVWNPIIDEGDLFPLLKKKGVRIITLFVGSEIRDYSIFKKQYHVYQWNIPKEYLKVPLKDKLKKMRVHEAYADAIFSVPDQSGLATRPYFHLQLPIDVDRINCKVADRSIPLIIHAPTNDDIKGTSVILICLERLRNEGFNFDFKLIRNIPNDELLKLLGDADILIDELILHGPGVLGLEAMAAGCLVMTRYLLESPSCFRPPVINVTPETLYDQLRLLLKQPEKIKKNALAGREYVQRNNRSEDVADLLLSKLNSDKFDYYPDYYSKTLGDLNFPDDHKDKN